MATVDILFIFLFKVHNVELFIKHIIYISFIAIVSLFYGDAVDIILENQRIIYEKVTIKNWRFCLYYSYKFRLQYAC